MEKLRKISVSLPDNLVTNLDYLAARTGTSRSAIISEFLGDAVDQTRKLFELVPPNPTPADIVRMRGQSAEVVRDRLSSLSSLADDLFTVPVCTCIVTPHERQENPSCPVHFGRSA